MEENRAAAQVGVTAALALASLIVIATRLVYRSMKRLIDLSDLLITIALVRRISKSGIMYYYLLLTLSRTRSLQRFKT